MVSVTPLFPAAPYWAIVKLRRFYSDQKNNEYSEVKVFDVYTDEALWMKHVESLARSSDTNWQAMQIIPAKVTVNVSVSVK